MNEHGVCSILEVSYAAFCHTTLKVSIDSTESEALITVTDCFAKLIVCKNRIVSMIMADGYTMGVCPGFKGYFGCYSFLG